jgi:hypothetical protein
MKDPIKYLDDAKCIAFDGEVAIVVVTAHKICEVMKKYAQDFFNEQVNFNKSEAEIQ